MRAQIISEISRLAELNEGTAPGQGMFARETGIIESKWRGIYWARWGDALIEAGFQPNTFTERNNLDIMLAGLTKCCRELGRMPTGAEQDLMRRRDRTIPSAKVLRTHIPSRIDLARRLLEFCTNNDEYRDVVGFIKVNEPTEKNKPVTRQNVDGDVYLFKSGDSYKIGKSGDLERRVKEVRIALPDKLEIIHTIKTDDPSGIEAYWHRRFASKRMNGEWFRLDRADVAAFRRRKFQ